MSKSHGFKKRFRQQYGAQACEVCRVSHNYRRGKPVQMNMDMAHLVAKTELARFGPIAAAFNYDPHNFALLCQKCHCAFDTYLGVMPRTEKRRITARFEQYRQEFWALLRRRHKMLLVLISLTAEDPRPAVGGRQGGSSLNSSNYVSPTNAEGPAGAITPSPAPDGV